MTTSMEAATSIRAPSRKKRVTRNPRRRRGLDTVEDDDERVPFTGPGADPKERSASSLIRAGRLVTLRSLCRHRLVYVASPYTNFPRGLDAACSEVSIVVGAMMRAGVKVFCPVAHSHTIAMLAGIDPKDHAFWLEQDRPLQDACDALAIIKLDTWHKSEGISAEFAQACIRDHPIYYIDPRHIEGCYMDAKGIALTAADLVGGDRAKTHGDKIINHQKIAAVWNGILTASGKAPNHPLDAHDVANMMEGLKIARRYCGDFNADDYIDGAGYAAVAGEIAARWKALPR